MSDDSAKRPWAQFRRRERHRAARQRDRPVDDDRAAYWRERDWLTSAVHELPSGVLDGAGGASIAACAEMLDGLDVFAQRCERLGLNDHREFIEGCRWHFDHYGHYLGRRRHLADYETYVRDRRGPLRVPDPPAPPRNLSRRPRPAG